MWVRGLKLLLAVLWIISTKVAPYVGAWIETHVLLRASLQEASHPMWVRGLKQTVTIYINVHQVAPYVGAWIETEVGSCVLRNAQVAPYVGAWIETQRRIYLQ